MTEIQADETYRNGLAVKRQITIYERILDARIQLQKGLSALNLLSKYESKNSKEVQDVINQAENAVLKLIDQAVDLRTKLLEANDITVSLGKRKRGSITDEIEISTLLSDSSRAYGDAVLEKWSRKVQASDALGVLGSKKFTILNQSVTSQISDSLRDMERLTDRTHVHRQAKITEPGKNERLGDSDIQKNIAIFDDSDFYQILLKDLVDKSMADSSAVGTGVKWTISKPKTKRPNLDTKASKGRKLRYHVQEKIQNFMAPVPIISWNDDQIDELFSGLFGHNLGHNDVDENDEQNE
ncbi:apoptosis-antagonizing transcription factor [Lipomyces japonicus]|uniref:apoptosis-antagonizing transcription factor n=1 Tax=Lipomyces japonicus TaxID=56871 RepID=UPI0034CDBBB8